MRASRFNIVMLIILLLAIAFGMLRWWQGPQLAGFTVTAMPLVQTVVATGRVVTLSRTQVSSEITAVVLKRFVQEGDHVVKGDALLQLRADEITAQVGQAETALTELAAHLRPQAAVALANAEIQLAQASREQVRRHDLTQRALLSTEALEQAVQAERLAGNALRAARLSATALAPGNIEEVLLQQQLAALQAQLAKTLVRAEVSGTVLTRNAEPGDLVQPGKVLFTIALAGSTELLVPLDERNLSRLALQQPAQAVADAYPENPFAAYVNFIAPSIDAQRGTVEVRLTVDPVPDFLRQDMTVSVNIETGRRQQAVVLPNDALGAIQGDQAQVLLLRAGKVYRQGVTLGLRGLAMSEIVSGLNVGDKVLSDAELPLDEGSRVRMLLAPTLLQTPQSNNANDPTTRNELPVKLN
ncbi:membrane protein [Arsukibacterium sp. MJ3]|uniref:efflux RND transporter periplasmic adaptor subunit n=1 Tax=Arsukibacterium sp. MJ3 TaxID=1632859 RepID=UPI000626FCC8|nr:efflux RND transporter periplasmic adaptor subunit [Arsukibacterium sp. MJ3]KKO48988.1 membrane protein [Arsukibacterium sp. MJ3]